MFYRKLIGLSFGEPRSQHVALIAERLCRVGKRAELVVVVLTRPDVAHTTQRIVLVSEAIVSDLVRKRGPLRCRAERNPFRS